MSRTYDFMNNVKLEIDLTDIDFIEKWEDAFTKAQEREKAINPTMRFSEKIRTMMDIYETVIDELFGEGTAKRIFGESRKFTDRTDVVSQIIAIGNKQKMEIQNRKIKKYIPGGK